MIKSHVDIIEEKAEIYASLLPSHVIVQFLTISSTMTLMSVKPSLIGPCVLISIIGNRPLSYEYLVIYKSKYTTYYLLD